MLASTSEIDPRADTPVMDWSELDVSALLPTGTVTLLLADVEGSTHRSIRHVHRRSISRPMHEYSRNAYRFG
jgi:hypothetical protein